LITNYEEFGSGQLFRRARGTGLVGSGPGVAARYYRDLAFVSGLALNGPEARRQATAKWDGSEMYQMYLGCRLVAEGLPLVTWSGVAIRRSILIPGETVDSYASRPRLDPCPIVERRLPLSHIPALVSDAINVPSPGGGHQVRARRVVLQFLVFTYPFWLVEYRRVQSWRYAAGIALGTRPRNLLEQIRLSPWTRLQIAAVYGLSTAVGMLLPVSVFGALRPGLYFLAKRLR
jgi:hypothetical protein